MNSLKILSIIISLITFTNCADDNIIDPKLKTPLPTGENSKNWELVFQDEFNSGSLDLTKWSIGTGWLEKSNQKTEKEYILFDEGNLILKAEVDTGAVYSGAINSKNKFFQKYGFFEARIKSALGSGFLSRWVGKQNFQDWAPAIDAVQILGDTSSDSLSAANFNNVGIRWLVAPERETIRRGKFALNEEMFQDDFHIFGVNWQPDTITWYLDGNEVFSFYEGAEHLNIPFYWIFDLTFCSDYVFPDYECPENPFPISAEMKVDYFRVWNSKQ